MPAAKSKTRPSTTTAKRSAPSSLESDFGRAFRLDNQVSTDTASKIDAWWRSVLHHERSVFAVYDAPPMLRIALVRRGVPAETVGIIADAMGIAKDRLYKTLGVSRATVERKIRGKERLGQDQGERVMGIARLVGQVDHIVHESGTPEGFHAARWLAGWLERPLPALGGRAPGTLLDTAEGRDLVSGLIAQIQSGAYA